MAKTVSAPKIVRVSRRMPDKTVILGSQKYGTICVGKQSEATPSGVDENMHLAKRVTLTHSAHGRPRLRHILVSGVDG